MRVARVLINRRICSHLLMLCRMSLSVPIRSANQMVDLLERAGTFREGPPVATPYRVTKVITEATLPAGLRHEHRTVDFHSVLTRHFCLQLTHTYGDASPWEGH